MRGVEQEGEHGKEGKEGGKGRGMMNMLQGLVLH